MAVDEYTSLDDVRDGLSDINLSDELVDDIISQITPDPEGEIKVSVVGPGETPDPDADLIVRQNEGGTITVRVEWDAALGRTAVASAALEREGEGVDITSQMLREVRTHWIMTTSALDVVTVDDIRPVDEPRVRLARRDLGQDRRDVLFDADGLDLDAGTGKQRRGRGAARHFGSAQDDR